MLPCVHLFLNHPAPIAEVAIQKICGSNRAKPGGCELQMVFYGAQNLRPPLAKVKTDKHKWGNPPHSAPICVQCKAAKADLRRSRHNRGEVTHAGDKVAHHQRPVADLVEPRMHAFNVFFLDVQKLSCAGMQKLPAYRSADDIAAGDSANAAGQCAGNRGSQLQMSLINQEAAACE